jgi:type I restriction enzyme S subunit
MLAHIDDNTHNIELKRSIIKENDILFTIAGTLGKFCIADKTFLPANTNQAVAIIRVDESKIHPIDIYAMFVSGVHEDYCKRNIQQAVQANLSLETISKIPIVLPHNDIMNIFHKNALSVFNAIFLTQQENIKLTELQSLLLARMGQ